MAAKKGSMEDFLSSLGKDSAVYKRLQARAIGRNPPKSMSGSTSVPAPSVKAAAPKAPALPAPKTKAYTSPTKQPELSKVVSRPLAARDSAKATMSDAAKKKFEAMRSSRTKGYAKGGKINDAAQRGKPKGRMI